MAAEANNKYAETVTREVALELANKALGFIDEDCFFLSEVAEKCDSYRHKFTYILNKFSDDDEVKDTIEKMYNKCESIVVRQAAKGKINVALGIFILKSYHGLMETTVSKHELEVNDLSNLYKKAMSSNEKDTSRESA
jgi:hypothetical protein